MPDHSQPDHPPSMFVELITRGIYVSADPATVTGGKVKPGMFHVSDLSGRLWSQGHDLDDVIARAWQKWHKRENQNTTIINGKWQPAEVREKFRSRFQRTPERNRS